jgi:hypothetical protein
VVLSLLYLGLCRLLGLVLSCRRSESDKDAEIVVLRQRCESSNVNSTDVSGTGEAFETFGAVVVLEEERQAGVGFSQEGWELVRTFSDQASGATTERPVPLFPVSCLCGPNDSDSRHNVSGVKLEHRPKHSRGATAGQGVVPHVTRD